MKRSRVGFTEFQPSYKQRAFFLWQSYDCERKETAKHADNIHREKSN